MTNRLKPEKTQCSQLMTDSLITKINFHKDMFNKI